MEKSPDIYIELILLWPCLVILRVAISKKVYQLDAYGIFLFGLLIYIFIYSFSSLVNNYIFLVLLFCTSLLFSILFILTGNKKITDLILGKEKYNIWVLFILIITVIFLLNIGDKYNNKIRLTWFFIVSLAHGIFCFLEKNRSSKES